MDSHFTYEEDMIENEEAEFTPHQRRLMAAIIGLGAITVGFMAFSLEIPAIICFTLHAIGWVYLYREDLESVQIDHKFELIESRQELDAQSLNNRKMEAEMNFQTQNNEETARMLEELRLSVEAKDREILSLTEENERLKITAQEERTAADQAEKAAFATLLPQAEAENDIAAVDIIAVARRSVEDLKDSTDKAGIKVELSTVFDKLLVKADPGRINILFRNIIDNSAKYMQVHGSLVITISTIGDDIFIVLKDNGEGLSEEETNRVFELNFQGSNRKSGNGLGLAQAKAIVDFYGGTIYAKSNCGQGMAIYIQLPATSRSI